MRTVFCSIINLLIFLNLNAQVPVYESHIEPIIQDHCVKCHHVGGIAPMPLTNYEEVASYGQMISYVTATRYMPPWLANAHQIEYRYENRLDSSEISILSDWVKNNMPVSNKKKNSTHQRKEVQLSNYDLVIEMEEEFEQYDIYSDQFQVFVIPFNIEQDTFVQAVEFVPGDERIIRSCQISITTDSSILKNDRWDPRYGYNSFGGVGIHVGYSHWFNWNAGDQPFQNQNHTFFLPAKGYALFHVHYGPTSDKLKDRSKLLLKFCANDQSIVQTFPLINQNQLTIKPLQIPPDSKKSFHATTTIPHGLSIHGVYPQSNLICRSWDIYAKIPGHQVPVRLLEIQDWDFKWRRNYEFMKSIYLPAGSEIHAFAQFDNTLKNLSLPDDQSSLIQWGDQMFEETFIVHFMASHSKGNNSINSDDPGTAQLLTSKPSYKRGIIDFGYKGTMKDQYSLKFLHWDSDYSKNIYLDDIDRQGSLVRVDLRNFPLGNYSLYLMDEHSNMINNIIFTLHNQ